MAKKSKKLMQSLGEVAPKQVKYAHRRRSSSSPNLETIVEEAREQSRDQSFEALFLSKKAFFVIPALLLSFVSYFLLCRQILTS